MNTSPVRCLPVLAALLLTFNLASAQPSGPVSFSFAGTEAPIFDFSGNLILQQEMDGAGEGGVPLSFTVGVTHDSKGRLTGQQFTFVDIGGGDVVAGFYTANGKVSGGGTKPVRVSLTVRITGEDLISGQSTRFSISVKYNLEANVNEGTLVGTARGTANFTGMSSGTIHSDVVVPIEPGMDGSWTLNMNILPLKKLSGTGTIVLSNGRTLPMDLSGNFSSKTGVTKVKLKGISEGLGSNLNISFADTEEGTVIEKMNGKVLGQSVRTLD